jgi:hypothetical protein
MPGSPTSLQDPKRANVGLVVASRRLFVAVIHSLWITLWITMLIACKRKFYVGEL